MGFDESIVLPSVYELRNILNGKRYVGSSVHSHARWNRHIRELTLQKHSNPKLQNAWNKYGPDAFVFTILERPEDITEEALRPLEQLYLADAVANGYNLSLDATAPMGNRKHSQATRDKMKKSHTGLKNTSEANRKIGEANKRRVITPEFRAKRAEIGRRRLGKHFGPMSEQGRKNVSEGKKGKQTGPWAKPMSEQGRLNISKAKLGKIYRAALP
jgi:group I intron endonuclease